jgi:hypothetical protein
MAFGWSLVNVKAYEREYSPRHLLEWEAILYYKIRVPNITNWERGITARNTLHSIGQRADNKRFKERYGGFTLPKIYWMGYS